MEDWDLERLEGLNHELLQTAYRAKIELGDESPMPASDQKDSVTLADLEINKAVRDAVRESGIPAILLAEEIVGEFPGREVMSAYPKFTIVLDEGDGSKNLESGNGLLPFCTVISIMDGTEPRYSDTLVAGAIMHSNGDIYIARKGFGSAIMPQAGGYNIVTTSGAQDFNPKGWVFLDLYAGGPKKTEKLKRLLDHRGEFWARDFGSAAVEYALLGSGKADGLVGLGFKAHERPFGYLFVKEAGGSLLGPDGKPFDSEKFDIDSVTEVYGGATLDLASKLHYIANGR